MGTHIFACFLYDSVNDKRFVATTLPTMINNNNNNNTQTEEHPIITTTTVNYTNVYIKKQDATTSSF